MQRRVSGLALVLLACGGGDKPAGPRLLAVAGTYQTAVTLIASTCPNTQVQTFPTVVSHVAGATAVQLTHAGSTYTGTVANNGAFSTPNEPFSIGGVNYLISMTGTFEVQSMNAVVTVQAGLTPPCQFSARWSGPKSGGPNVFP